MKTSGKGICLSSKKPSEYNHQKTLEACDTYSDGLFAVLALINEARWDESARKLDASVQFALGRRMTTSSDNKVSASAEVTPDCLIQLDSKYGIVGETKLGLPKDAASWKNHVPQLRKYDDKLTGWWTSNEQIAKHDIIALVPISRAVKFADQVEKVQKDQGWQFERNVAIVGFFKQSGVKDFLNLKKERGDLSVKALSDRLRESRAVAGAKTPLYLTR